MDNPGWTKRKAAMEVYLVTLEVTNGNKTQACARAERGIRTIRSWRQRYPDFRRKEREILDRVAEVAGEQTRADLTGEVSPNAPVAAGVPVWPYGFTRFRKRFFDMDTPEFQVEMVDAYERTKPGNITMILVPPEHGKTTLFEDYASMKLATNPQYRITVGCEAQALARRILRRVKNRMTPGPPFDLFVDWWGPMSPEDHRNDHSGQVWGADQFDVMRKRHGDERDYSMVALGATSQIAGTRTDHLHVDDITSMRNVNQTELLLQTFRQDWLSRPGEDGIITINGTRVDVGDFYERIEDEIPPDILTVIRKPAIVYDPELEAHRPLWPEKYSMENLRRIRDKVGEESWARNYMQQPMAKSSASFTPELVDPCKDALVDIHTHNIDPDHGFILSCDPSIGGRNVWMVLEVSPRWIMPVWIEVSERLTSYDQIFAIMARLLRRYTASGARCASVVIESVAFQKGLLEDMRLKELEMLYGFSTEPHSTGRNKADPIIGVPAIPSSFRRQEIRIPWGGDDTQTMMQLFIDELYRWRPLKRGTQLVQDQVMAFWFGWRWWQSQRAVIDIVATKRHGDLEFGGLPYEPTPLPKMNTTIPTYQSRRRHGGH